MKCPAPAQLLSLTYDSITGKPYPAVAVLVAKNGKILFERAYGYADIEKKTPATTKTKFRIGSITKQFVASGILKLNEQKKLSLSDKLSKFIPDFPRGDEVTIHQLLTHISGIHSYTGTDSFFIKVTSKISSDSLLSYIKKLPFDFNPGERILYNNSGYFLAGFIIEKVSGKSLGQYLHDTFFKPLNMLNTGMHASDLKLTNEAKGYEREGNAFKRALNWDMSWAAGAGGLYSTINDLYKWNEALFSGKVISDSSRQLAFTPVKLNDGKVAPEMSYGYGWAINDYRGRQVIEHSGGLNGFISQLARFRNDNLTVVMLTNVSPPYVDLSPNRIAEYFLWQKMDSQASYSAKSALTSLQLDEYQGRYDFGNLGALTITAEDGKLFAQLNTQPRFEIFPSARDEFFWKVVEAKMKFVRDESGAVVSGDFIQGGLKVSAKKLGDEKLVALDTTLSPLYVGKYRLQSSVITVTAARNKLFAAQDSQPPFELLPLSGKEFLIRELNARIIFNSENNQKAASINIIMGTSNTVAKRVE